MSRTATPPSGWLLHDLDTRRQAVIVRESAESWRGDIEQQVRLALVLGRRLLLTDTQVFDGAALLLLGPAGLREMCGFPETQAIHVAMRDGRPGVALQKMLEAGGFRSEVRAALPAAVTDQMIEEARLAWVTAIARGEIASGTYPDRTGTFAELMATALSTTPRVSEAGARDLRALAQETHRSRALDHLDMMAPGPDRASLERWWMSAYMSALAKQHHARWLGTETSGINDGEASGRAVSAWLARSLGSLSPSAFHDLLYDVVLLRHPSTALHRSRRWFRHLRITLALVAATAPVTPVLSAAQTFFRVLAWLGLGTLALSDELRGELSGSWAVAAVGAATALQVPWNDLIELGRSFRSLRYAQQRE